MDFLHDTHIWFAFSFLVFLGLAWKFGKDGVVAKLDDRIESIKKELTTAENLRVEAQELLAQYQRKHRDAVQESEQIIANAKKHAKDVQKQAEKDLNETMARREKQLQERLETMKQSAIGEIQQYAANLSIEATQEIIASTLDKKTNERLVDDSIKALDKNLH